MYYRPQVESQLKLVEDNRHLVDSFIDAKKQKDVDMLFELYQIAASLDGLLEYFQFLNKVIEV